MWRYPNQFCAWESGAVQGLVVGMVTLLSFTLVANLKHRQGTHRRLP
jgi:uncharacterized membrane protein YoaT (DUF817 family)